MENFQGDLTDILLAGSGRHVAQSSSSSSANPAPGTWQPSDLPMNNFPSSDGRHNYSFGDPFLNMTDPLLHELNMVAAASGSYFPNASPKDNFVISRGFKEDGIPRIKIPNGIRHESSPCNSPLFSASACNSPLFSGSGIGNYGASPGSAVSGNVINVDTNNNSPRQQLQISSPRNLGLKRRKSQAKKVVCIPAPAAANSRSTGEIVPSDLWAWRKYGQKPIKGSPYPRGYYRCSSSKGCSARKQVERSRTDPSMLVITYTSEHNHPWPTQRNALAGSTRSVHPTKPNTSNSSRSSQNPSNTNNLTTMMVKEEVDDKKEHDEFDGGIGDFRNQSEDFFADLDELGTDSLSLLFDQRGFGLGDEDDQKSKQESESFEDFLDWSENNNNNNNYVCFGETARSL